MRGALVLVVSALIGCGPEVTHETGQIDAPLQSPDRAVAALVEAIRVCSAGVRMPGTIDQAAMAARGWRVVRRSVFKEGRGERELAVDEFPTLGPADLEISDWTRDGVAGRIQVTRWANAPGLHDSCTFLAQTETRHTAATVIAVMTRHFGREPDRQGRLSRGNDSLTRQLDSRTFARYWALPNNDVYLATDTGGFIELEAIAMPDRAALAPNHPDNPETRIPIVEGIS